jgi:hypothetical protein
MQFELNKELTLKDRKELIKGLTQVAEMYFNSQYRFEKFEGNKDAEYVNITNGICNALGDLGFAGYSLIEKLQIEMQNDFDNYCKITSPEGWEPRANMCLFMVEYLKDTIKKVKA